MGGTTNPTNDEVDEVELVLPGESLESGQGLELRLQGGDKRRISRLESIDDSDVLKEWSRGQKRFVGVLMACVVGCFFGCSFNPAQWVIDNQPYTAVPEPSLVFIFPHFLRYCLVLISVLCRVLCGHAIPLPEKALRDPGGGITCGSLWLNVGHCGDQLVRGQREPGVSPLPFPLSPPGQAL